MCNEICRNCDVALVSEHPEAKRDGFCWGCYLEDQQAALEAMAFMAGEDANSEFDEAACEDERYGEEYDQFRDDVEADADVLRSCGWGTDEDYGGYDGMDYDFGMYDE